MSSGTEPLTPQGHVRLTEKLDYLKNVERRKNIKDIEEARAHGDLSENAEYQYAKNRQAEIAHRISRIEDTLARSEIIDPSKLKSNRVVFGATVTVYDTDEDKEIVYKIIGQRELEILGAPEDDKEKTWISVRSPIARAMIGKEVDDEVIVNTPKAQRYLEIVSIRYE